MRAYALAAILILGSGPVFAQDEPPEVRARLFPCLQPADPAFAGIIAACSALLDDKTIHLGSQRIAGIHISRANAYDELHDPAHARADYDAGIAIDPQNALGYYNRGLFLARQKDTAAAQADFTKCVSLDDSVAPAHFYLGQMAFEKGDYDTALRQFNETIRLDPGKAMPYMLRGTTLMKLGQTDKGIADLKIAVGLDPALGKDIIVDGKPLN